MDFHSISVSHHNTTLEIREFVALNHNECDLLYQNLKDILGLEDALIVSTCNRTEIYYDNIFGKELHYHQVIKLLAQIKSTDSEILIKCFQHYEDKDALRHLYEVSLGVDSQILGDIQISNQIKRAYQQSIDNQMTGPLLHRVLHSIFYSNKKVVQETSLQDGNASVGAVATDLVKGFILNIRSPKIAIVGLGEVGENVLENIKRLEGQIFVLNRTLSKADNFVNENNIEATVRPLSQLSETINEVDVVVSCVSPHQEILTKNSLKKTNQNQHKLIVDLSVPRSTSDDVRELPWVLLYNVDQLTAKSGETLKKRKGCLPDVHKIIDESIEDFQQWKDEMEVSPTIQKLKSTLDKIRRQELDRHSRKVSEKEMELLNVVTKNMIQKVIKLPVLELKAACLRGESENLVGIIHDLFQLEKNTEDTKVNSK